MITDGGLDHLADQMLDTPTQNTMTHMAIGIGSTTEAATDTTLESEQARVSLTSKIRSSNVVTYIADFPAGTGTGAVTEAAILNAGTVGDMLNRIVFPVKNKGATDSLQITQTLTLQRV
jgi:hypothetical protein